jgi:hypothetical protein
MACLLAWLTEETHLRLMLGRNNTCANLLIDNDELHYLFLFVCGCAVFRLPIVSSNISNCHDSSVSVDERWETVSTKNLKTVKGNS